MADNDFGGANFLGQELMAEVFCFFKYFFEYSKEGIFRRFTKILRFV